MTSRTALAVLAIAGSAACSDSGAATIDPAAHVTPHATEDGGADAADASPVVDAADAALAPVDAGPQFGDPCDPDSGDPCPGSYPGTKSAPLFCGSWGHDVGDPPSFSTCSVICNIAVDGLSCAADAGICVDDALSPGGMMCVPAAWCPSASGCLPFPPDGG